MLEKTNKLEPTLRIIFGASGISNLWYEMKVGKFIFKGESWS